MCSDHTDQLANA